MFDGGTVFAGRRVGVMCFGFAALLHTPMLGHIRPFMHVFSVVKDRALTPQAEETLAGL